MKIIILGDPHIGKNLSQGKAGIGAALNSRIVDQFNLLDWVLEQALENHVEHIFITGDVFEEPKPLPLFIALFISWLKKCQLHQVNVHIVMGNHDTLRHGMIYTSPLDIIIEADLDLIHIYKEVSTIILDTTAFTLIPFRDRKSLFTTSNKEALQLINDSLTYEMASIPLTYHKILIGHLAIEGSIPVGDEIDDLTNELFIPLDMLKFYDYVWMGHVHKPQVLQKSPHIAHIGSMDISNFTENNDKKHIIIFDTVNNSFDTEYLPVRPLQKVSITVPADIDNSTDYVLDELKKSLVCKNSIFKLDISLSSSELKSIDKSIIDQYLINQGVFHISGISESKKVNILKKENNNIDNKMDVNLAIKEYAKIYITERNREGFIDLALDLYNIFKESN